MNLRAQSEGLAMPATIAAVLARDVMVAITGIRTQIKTNRDRIVLKARKSSSKVKFAIVYQPCLF